MSTYDMQPDDSTDENALMLDQWWRIIKFAVNAFEEVVITDFAWYRRLRGGHWEFLCEDPMRMGVWIRRETRLPKMRVRK